MLKEDASSKYYYARIIACKAIKLDKALYQNFQKIIWNNSHEIYEKIIIPLLLITTSSLAIADNNPVAFGDVVGRDLSVTGFGYLEAG